MHNEITEGAQLSGDRRCARGRGSASLSPSSRAFSSTFLFPYFPPSSLPQQVRLLRLAFGGAFSAFPGTRMLPFEIGLGK